MTVPMETLTTTSSNTLLNQLLSAAKYVDQQLIKDETSIELWDLLSASSSGEYTVDSIPHFIKEKFMVLPDALFEQYDLLECKCFMGLFPEINRAWLTIDQKLFLWNYNDGSDFFVFDELDQIIVSVALVIPRRGVFIDEVKYMLVIATPLEVILMGVCFSKKKKSLGLSENEELSLYPTHLSVPTDHVHMLSICGTPAGRIFMSGKDGNVYEVVYQAQEGWFTKKCKKVNHTKTALSLFMPTFIKTATEDAILTMTFDTTRNMLYTLSENSNIQLFYMGTNGLETHLIVHLSGIAHQAQKLCPRTHLLDQKLFKIVSIHAITLIESKYVHLIAISSNGVRLYFSAIGRHLRSYIMTQQDYLQPTTLELIHVRLPPAPRTFPTNGTQRYLSQNVLNNVHSTIYACGLLVMANAINDETDSLLCMGPDITEISKSAKHFLETATEILVEGKPWALAEIMDAPIGNYLGDNNKDGEDFVALRELTNQLHLPAKRLLVLTNAGIHVLVKLRPVDQLRQLLIESNGQETELLRDFFERYGKEQACAMCLMIIANSVQINNVSTYFESGLPVAPAKMMEQNLVLWAKYAFFRLGGEPKVYERPAILNEMSDIGRPVSSPEVKFSGAHNGLYLHFSRVMKHIWKRSILSVKKATLETQTFSLIPESTLNYLLQQTSVLRDFLSQNPYFFVPKTLSDIQSIESVGSRGRSQQALRGLEDALKAEHQSLMYFQKLLIQCFEGVAFIILLHDYNFGQILQTLPELYRSELLSITFEDFITTSRGQDLSKALVTSLVNKHMAESMSVDAISDILRQRCPSFFSGEDVILHKGSELLQKARNDYNMKEREELLKEALRLFTNIAGHISGQKLQGICTELQGMCCHASAVELALQCAKEKDIADFAIGYYRDGFLPNDIREESFKARQQCYECIFRILEDLFLCITSSNKSLQGEIASRNISRIPPHEIEKIKVQVFQSLSVADDELFHISLYDWLISQGFTTQLLELQTPYLETYLQRRANEFQGDNIDLLWKFYVRNRKYYPAAKALAELAEGVDRDFDLKKRIEYLSLAVTNAKSYVPSAGSVYVDEGLPQELEDKMEVAHIQLQIYKEIEQLPQSNLVALNELNHNLYDISILYNNYASPMKLYESCLSILKCSGHDDPHLVSQLWSSIIEKELGKVQPIGGHALAAISNKVKEIGRQHYPSEIVFPLDMLINALERCSLDNHVTSQERGWVFQSMREVGVPYYTLFDIYHRLFVTKALGWQEIPSMIHLISTVQALISSWLEQSRPVSLYKTTSEMETLPVKNIDEVLTSYLMILESQSQSEVKMCLAELKRIQRQLRNNF